MKTILVAGGAGFIGSHLCRRLLAEGEQVICLDNLLTGSEANIQDLIANKNFQFIKHDIEEPYFAQVDQIYNLACPASPEHYQADPVKTTTTSVLGAINLLNLARQTGARILQASTSEVYGDPQVHPQTEDYFGHVNCLGPRSCYDESKRVAESLFMDYHKQYQVDIRIIRIFNTYGPYLATNDGRVISNFIIQALKNENISINGDGSQTRSFQYIDDLINGMVLMMNNTQNFIGPVNLGNPAEFTIKELAEKVLALLPESQSKLSYLPALTDDPKKRRPDISLAKQILNWSPSISLAEGLEKTIQYFKNTI